MSFRTFCRALPLSLVIFTITASAGENSARCQEQAARVVERLQEEVVGELSAERQSSARRIVAENCQAQAQAPGAQAPAGAGEEDGSGFWSTDSPDKAGNERLKRRGRY